MRCDPPRTFGRSEHNPDLFTGRPASRGRVMLSVLSEFAGREICFFDRMDYHRWAKRATPLPIRGRLARLEQFAWGG